MTLCTAYESRDPNRTRTTHHPDAPDEAVRGGADQAGARQRLPTQHERPARVAAAEVDGAGRVDLEGLAREPCVAGGGAVGRHLWFEGGGFGGGVSRSGRDQWVPMRKLGADGVRSHVRTCSPSPLREANLAT